MGLWFEPTDSEKQPQYPYNRATVTESGHSQEFDDTPGNERIRTQHRSGSFQEYQNTGNVVNKIVGNGYTIVAKDNNVVISGKCSVTIYGDVEMEIGGNLYSRVKGDAKINTTGDCEVTSKGDTILTAEGVVNVNASEINLSATDAVYVDCDLNVRGTVTGQQSICAFGNVTAGGHIGAQGSLNIMGGVPQQGGPPLPHIITGMLGSYTNCLGPITFTSAAAISSTAAGAISITSGLGMSIKSGIAMSLGASTAISLKSATASIAAPLTSIKGITSVIGATSIKGFTNILGMKLTTGIDRDGGGSTGLSTHIHPTALGPTGPGKG